MMHVHLNIREVHPHAHAWAMPRYIYIYVCVYAYTHILGMRMCHGMGFNASYDHSTHVHWRLGTLAHIGFDGLSVSNPFSGHFGRFIGTPQTTQSAQTSRWPWCSMYHGFLLFFPFSGVEGDERFARSLTAEERIQSSARNN
jgi:hypothetical protein